MEEESMRRIYMDANATSPVRDEVVEAMSPFWRSNFGNASSIHLDGQQARAAVEQGREQLAEFLGCHAAEVVFTSGATESDNTALMGMLGPGDHLVTTAIEHPAVIESAKRLEKFGVTVSFVAPEADGAVRAEAIQAAMRPETKLVSVMLANNETGVLQPVEEIGALVREAGCYFHIDAVQGAGKLAMDVKRWGCHLLSLSAHKMYGPKGMGALYVRRGTPLESRMVGGKHERRRRAGTENVAGIVGMGCAAARSMASVEAGLPEQIARLRDRLEQGILAISGTGVNGTAKRVGNTTNLWFEQLEGEALVIALDLKGIAVSGGAACSSGTTEPSPVLLAMGVDEERARASLRFSLLETATVEEVDHVIAVMPELVASLRELSPSVAGTLG